jgi:hypothetical protein
MYQMNHRVVANGTPLDRSFDNVALLAQRAGYAPVLFGYTDQAIDPRDATGPDDWRLNSYEGVLPGFDCKLFIPENHVLWIEHLRANGFDVPMNAQQVLKTEPNRPAEFGISAFLTDHLLAWLDQQNGPWFAHASYLRRRRLRRPRTHRAVRLQATGMAETWRRWYLEICMECTG